MTALLEFEQPIAELEASINSYIAYCREKGLDENEARTMLEEHLPDLRERIYGKLTAWDKVQIARHAERPYPIDYCNMIFSDFMELHGDRRYSDDQAICGGFARLGNRNVMLIMTRKGRNLQENIRCNFGSAHPEGYRKAQRLMKLADKAGCPIICLVDTAGAYPGVGAEERHIGEAIAVSIQDMFRLKVPVISVITGEGGSGGALALAIANRVLVMEYAYYSVITPEGCAAILWRSDAEIPHAAEALKLTADNLLKLHVADGIVKEPLGGAHHDWKKAADYLKNELESQLSQLEKLKPELLQSGRYDRFRRLGCVSEEDNADTINLRKPRENEVTLIYDFFEPFVQKQQILPRTEKEIRRQLGNFTLAVDSDDHIVGTIALRDFGDGLFEIRSLAVSPQSVGQGIGSKLIYAAVELAKSMNAKRIFTLTNKPRLFQRCGFSVASIMRFPDKVQNDCLKCPKKEFCDETALFLDV